MTPNPIKYLLRKFVRPRPEPRERIEFAAVFLVPFAGLAAGWLTTVRDHLINPRALVVGAAIIAAYKTIETVVDAFGKENNAFDEALAGVFKVVSGWLVLAGTGYALIQTLRNDDLWFAVSLLALSLLFAIWGAYRAEQAAQSATEEPLPTP